MNTTSRPASDFSKQVASIQKLAMKCASAQMCSHRSAKGHARPLGLELLLEGSGVLDRMLKSAWFMSGCMAPKVACFEQECHTLGGHVQGHVLFQVSQSCLLNAPNSEAHPLRRLAAALQRIRGSLGPQKKKNTGPQRLHFLSATHKEACVRPQTIRINITSNRKMCTH